MTSGDTLAPLPTDGRLRVWAPSASRVDLHLGLTASAEGGPAAMSSDEELAAAGRPGWWVSPDAAAPMTDYSFAVDGGEPRPDPRSPWQPAGVHAASRTFDPSVHEWGDGDWRGRSALGAVGYELHIGTFTPEGTLDAAIERLDHLVDLGVQVVELMPLAAFPGERGWGYDGVALYAVHEAYGGPSALQRFVDAAHRAGIAVLLDAVYNHLGPDGNYLGEFGPYFTDRHETPWGAAVNLDGENSAEVRSFVVDNAVRWMRDFHIDGLRLDAVHALIDDSEVHLLSTLATATSQLEAQLGRPLTLIAESDLNDPRMVAPVGEETASGPGLGMDGQWDDDIHHSLHALFTGETHGYYADFGSAAAFTKVMEDVFLHAGTYSNFRGRVWGAPVSKETDRHRFVAFSQNHDQVGNRAIGDRPSRTQSPGQLVGAAAVVLLGPYTPMLFQGEEWGTTAPFQYFTDHETALGLLVSEGRLAEFGGHGWDELYGGPIDVPDPQSRAAFEGSTLPWEEREEPGHARILEAYRALIALRSEPDIASGDGAETSVEFGPDDAWFVLRRGSIDVVVELSGVPADVPLRSADPALRFCFSDGAEASVAGESLRLPGHGVAVLEHA